MPSPRPLPRAHDQGRCGRPPVYAACTLPRAAFGERGRLQTLPGDAAQAPQPHPVRARAGLASAPAAGGCPEPRFTAHPPCDGAPALVGSGQEASRRTGCLPWDPWSQDHARLSCLLSSLEFLCQGILKPPPGQHAGQSSSAGGGGLCEARAVAARGPLPQALCHHGGPNGPSPQRLPHRCADCYGPSQDTGSLSRTGGLWASASPREGGQPGLEGPCAGCRGGHVSRPLCVTILEAAASLRPQPPGAIKKSNCQLPEHSA